MEDKKQNTHNLIAIVLLIFLCLGLYHNFLLTLGIILLLVVFVFILHLFSGVSGYVDRIYKRNKEELDNND